MADPPELNADCVACVLCFVCEDDWKSVLGVCTLWRSAALDPRAAFWSVLDAHRFALLRPPSASAAADAPAFCACALAAALRRYGPVLRAVDASGLQPCAAAGPQPSVHRCSILRGISALPSLCTLSLAWPAPAAPSGAAAPARRCGAPRRTPAAPAPALPALPSLTSLDLSHDLSLGGPALAAWLAAAPRLAELRAAGCPLLLLPAAAAPGGGASPARALLAPRSLRCNLLDGSPLAPALDVACGLCGAPFWANLASYCRAPGTQPHIDAELYTQERPLGGALAPSAGAGLGPGALNCARGDCHSRFGLYLVDAGTGGVQLHGWAFGVALGAGRRGRAAPAGGQRAVPPLALATPSPAAAAGAAGAG